jgi:septal ring factor EnvC (AmiA/AmiB activator)
VPVTIRLSKALGDRLGEEAANELVEWFNAVDATYRADLREFNEVNFARFDAKLEQRLAEFRAHIGADLREVRAQLTAFDVRLTALEGRVGALEQGIRDLRVEMSDRFALQTRWLLVAIVAAWASLMGAQFFGR